MKRQPAPRKPTAAQLKYLRALARQTGRTFAYPKTLREASAQIQLLKSGRETATDEERAWERLSASRDREHIARETQERPREATRFDESEIAGWGSSARYADPWDGHHTKKDGTT